IVGIESDFLGPWLSPVEFPREYAMRRRPESAAPMSRHVQFESGVSLTGSNADLRVAIRPSQQALVVLGLLRRLARKRGDAAVPDLDASAPDQRPLDSTANALMRQRGGCPLGAGRD